jgi:hypothetical protein
MKRKRKKRRRSEAAHLLADQLPGVRKTFEGAIAAGCEDPVIQFFNLGERESLEVAAEIIGQELKAQLAGELEGGHRGDVVPSCNCAMSRSDAAEWLSQRPAFKIVADYLTKPQDTEAYIRCIVYDGPDVAIVDVPRHGPTAPLDEFVIGPHEIGE